MQYRDLGRLTRTLHICFAVVAAVSLISAVSSWFQLEFLQRALAGAGVTVEQGLANDRRQAIVGVVQLVAYLVSSVAFLQWTYWSTRNAHALGMRMPGTTPAWSVGWYFVPFFNLWKPYQALRDTFRGSHPESRVWRTAPRPALLPVWWALWLIVTWLGNASARLAILNGSLEGFMMATSLDIGVGLLEIPLVVVLFALSSTLYRWQTEKHARSGDEGIVHDVRLPKSSPRRTLAVISLVQATSVGIVLFAPFGSSLTGNQPVEATSVGLSDADVVRDIATITEFIQREWNGQDPPLSLEEVKARWREVGNGSFPLDPFDGLDYGYEQDGVGFRLWSSGRDGVRGTADDQVQDWTLLH